jgi:hypothetical protein
MSARSRLLPFLPLLAGLALSLAYWPGLVTYDSVRQYDQALSGAFDDWHPPMTEWIWRQFIPLWAGPAPMLLLQLLLYALGLAGLIGWAVRRGRGRLAFAIGCTALLPLSFALMGAVLKDGLMTGALMAACALALRSRHDGGRAAQIGCLALVLLAATLRFNAFLAGVPILIAALPARAHVRRAYALAVTLLCAALLLVAMPIANRLLRAESSDVGLSLIIFDLAGITVHSGVDAFPAMDGVADPVALARRCYTPVKWDSFSWWVDPLCPIHFEKVRRTFRARQIGRAHV